MEAWSVWARQGQEAPRGHARPLVLPSSPAALETAEQFIQAGAGLCSFTAAPAGLGAESGRQELPGRLVGAPGLGLLHRGSKEVASGMGSPVQEARALGGVCACVRQRARWPVAPRGLPSQNKSCAVEMSSLGWERRGWRPGLPEGSGKGQVSAQGSVARAQHSRARGCGNWTLANLKGHSVPREEVGSAALLRVMGLDAHLSQPPGEAMKPEKAPWVRKGQ